MTPFPFVLRSVRAKRACVSKDEASGAAVPLRPSRRPLRGLLRANGEG